MKTLDDFEKVSSEKLDSLIEYKKERMAELEYPTEFRKNIFELLDIAGMKEELLALEELKFSRTLIGCGALYACHTME